MAFRAACGESSDATERALRRTQRGDLRRAVEDGGWKVAEALIGVSGDAGVVDIALGGYVQEVATFVGGRGGAYAFLQECVHETLLMGPWSVGPKGRMTRYDWGDERPVFV